MAGGGKEETNEYTPTWVVAVVYTAIVAVSFAVERFLHYVGVKLQENKSALYEALQKIKEELMLLGFISLLLTVSEDWILKICVSPDLISRMLPCWKKNKHGTVPDRIAEGPAASDDKKRYCANKEEQESPLRSPSENQRRFELMLLGFISLLLTVSEDWIIKIRVSPDLIRRMHPCWKKDNNGTVHHLSAEGPAAFDDNKDKVPLISVKVVHDLHIFIFTLAVVHVIYCVLTVFIGRLKIRQWKHWEDSIAAGNYAVDRKLPQPRSPHVLMGWLHSFWKQFHGSVYKSDYLTIRHGFIMNRKENRSFNFYEYMINALEDDFKHVVGISWHFWIFVVIFFLLSVRGWYTYFWIAFIPCLLLLAVGTKLEHVLMQLVHDVSDGAAGQSDNYFWFRRPRFVLFLIHFIFFQNSFEIGFFFWIWLKAAYNFDACVMGKLGFIVVTLVIGVSIQLLSSCSTLPVYALVTQMRDRKEEREQELVGHPP